MKKSLAFIALILIISISSIEAVEITLSKEDYSPLETLQAEITGNFISLNQDNIYIYNNLEPRPVPVISDFFYNNNIYYYYAVLPKTEGNYSLKIIDSQYTVEGDLTSESLTKDFLIKKTNYSYTSLSINPGFIVSSNDFSIKIKSPFKNQLVNIDFIGTSIKKNVSLIEDQEKSIDFSINDINIENTVIKINDYTIPVFLLNVSGVEEKKELSFFPKSLDATVIAGNSYFFQVLIENTGNKNLTDIVLSNNIGLLITPDTIPTLPRYEKKLINISINISKNAKNNISGRIFADYEQKTSSIDVFIALTKNQSNVNLSGTTILPDLSCSKLNGLVCIYPEKCTGESTESLEGPCCIGECKVDSSGGKSNNWVLGIIALVIIGLIGFVLYKTSRKKPKTAEQILDDKTKRFEKRMANEQTSEEVKGKLGRE